jgi:hypothetical protein
MSNITEAGKVLFNPLENPNFREAYDSLYSQISQIVQFHDVNAMNIALILRAVLETIESLADAEKWDDVTCQNNVTALTTYILNDLHTKGKIDDSMFSALCTAMPVMSYSLYELVRHAATGELKIRQLMLELEDDIAKGGCCKKVQPVTKVSARKRRAN